MALQYDELLEDFGSNSQLDDIVIGEEGFAVDAPHDPWQPPALKQNYILRIFKKKFCGFLLSQISKIFVDFHE